MDMLSEFRTDLRNGMELGAALEKHNLTLQDALEIGLAPKKHSYPIPFETVDKYIYCRCGNYSIRKSIKSRGVHFGTYTSLEDAIRVRDYFVENGWNIRELDNVCRMLGVNRR